VAKVYFADLKANQESLLRKVDRLCTACGMDQFINKGDLVAIKMHFGEPGNTGYVRAQYVRRLVDKLTKLGARPFLTDANTLYVGRRSNAVDHLRSAVLNGFDFAVAGAPVIIADGLTGKDYVNVPIEGKHFREVKIGSAVAHADALVAVTHFKGHEATGFGGVLKNLGMGSGSRAGKQMMHSDVLPVVDEEKCTGCGRCNRWCPTGAAALVGKKTRIDQDKCIGCGECTVTCGEQAIAVNWKTEPDIIQEKIVEYVMGVLTNKTGKAAFLTFVTNVTPDCDCWHWSDAPIVRNIGILASVDPVALDQAAVDLVNKEAALPDGRLAGLSAGSDKFRTLYPGVDWQRQLAYAQAMGLGTRDYELVRI
jgi:uncharacterized Fe-S center protein